jgi:hypothetical protein
MAVLNINELSGAGVNETQFDGDFVDLMEIKAGDNVVSWVGIAQPDDDVFLQSDIHCLGSAVALIRAAKAGVPYVHVDTDRVLVPAAWLRAESRSDADRVRVIDNLTAFVLDQCLTC